MHTQDSFFNSPHQATCEQVERLYHLGYPFKISLSGHNSAFIGMYLYVLLCNHIHKQLTFISDQSTKSMLLNKQPHLPLTLSTANSHTGVKINKMVLRFYTSSPSRQ